MNASNLAHKLVLTTFCALALAACGGGGGDGGSGSTADTQKPTANIVFPPMDALANSEQLIVRGSAQDNASVNAVRVNGVAATSSDNFATWTAAVALEPGENTITVEVEDAAGNVETNGASVTVTRDVEHLVAPTGIKLDAANNRTLVLSMGQRSLYAIDETTGERSTISSPRVGDGPTMRVPSEFDVTADGKTAYVVDRGLRGIVKIDLATGDRELFASGDASKLADPIDIALDEANTRAFVSQTSFDYTKYGIIEIDLDTGNGTIIANYNTGSGAAFNVPYAVEWDTANNRVLTNTFDTDLLAIDPATKVRTQLVGDAVSYVNDLAFDPATGNVYATDGEGIHLFDVGSGISSVVSDAGTGTGEYGSVNAIALDNANSRILAGDSFLHDVFAANLGDGNRSTVYSDSSIRIGSGPTFPSGHSAMDLAGGSAFIFRWEDRQFMKVNLTTGERSLLGDPVANSQIQLVFDPNGNRVLAFEGETINAFDADSGAKTVLGVPAGLPANFIPIAASFDADSNRIFVSSANDRDSLYAINLDGMQTFPVTGPAHGTGTGEALRNLRVTAIDTMRGSVIGIDQEPETLRSIAIDSGDRSTLTDSTMGNLGQVTAITVGASGNIAYLAQSGLSGLATYRLDNGDYNTPVGPLLAGSTNTLPNINSVAVDETAQLAWGTAYDSVYVMDLVGGDMVIVSR